MLGSSALTPAQRGWSRLRANRSKRTTIPDTQTVTATGQVNAQECYCPSLMEALQITVCVLSNTQPDAKVECEPGSILYLRLQFLILDPLLQ